MDVLAAYFPKHEFNEKGVCVNCGCLKSLDDKGNLPMDQQLLHPLSSCPNPPNETLTPSRIYYTEEEIVRAKEIVLYKLTVSLGEKLKETQEKNWQFERRIRELKREIELLKAELEIYKSDPQNQGRTITTLTKDRDLTTDLLERKIERAILILSGRYPVD